jgi:hypothetical protein
VGTPAASDLTLALGAGHGDEGDALFQGPAQEQVLPAQPKPANPEAAISDDAPSAVIVLAARTTKPEAAETTAVTREAAGLVMTRPKPEKRKNAKERAKERSKGKPEAAEVAAVTPEAVGLATAHPKPEKRKNAKERAKEKYAKKSTEDRTTPDTTAKAKSKVDKKADAKATKSKAA